MSVEISEVRHSCGGARTAFEQGRSLHTAIGTVQSNANPLAFSSQQNRTTTIRWSFDGGPALDGARVCPFCEERLSIEARGDA